MALNDLLIHVTEIVSYAYLAMQLSQKHSVFISKRKNDYKNTCRSISRALIEKVSCISV